MAKASVQDCRARIHLLGAAILAALAAGCHDRGPVAIGDAGADAGFGTQSRVLLFGGRRGSDINGVLGDTWIWDGATWTQRAVSGPPSRSSASGAGIGGQVILFGGLGKVNDAGTNALGDTWGWDGTSWRQLDVVGPSGRAFAQGAAVGGQFVFYGGYGPPLGGTNDLWSWDGQRWTELQSNSGVGNPLPNAPGITIGLAATSFRDALFLTDGPSIWLWNGNWRRLPDDGGVLAGPRSREGAAAATVGGQVVLFGGGDESGGHGLVLFSETWLWNGSAWNQATTPAGLTGRTGMGMAALGNTLVLFGGNDGTNDLNDTWIWDGTRWTQVATPPDLSARSSPLMVAY
jgi:hypothetical protein